MCDLEFTGRKGFPLALLGLCFLLMGAKPEAPLPDQDRNPMERREEKLKAFREKRNQFFKTDPQSPLEEADRKKFNGLSYYPINLTYAMVGTIERYPVEPEPLYASLPTSKGMEKKYVKYGVFKFKVSGKAVVLRIYRPLGGMELFLPFKDKTSEKETYPHGRYLFLESMPRGKVLVDFNRAYNPFCAFNEKYTCPFAPEENTLDALIRAGEKRFR
jgi:uncharacterized protein (DUF1684 family)